MIFSSYVDNNETVPVTGKNFIGNNPPFPYLFWNYKPKEEKTITKVV